MAKYDIKTLRSEFGITQKELADRLNISQGFLSSVESGRNPFPDERVTDLQAIFPEVNLEEYEICTTTKRTIIGSHNNNSEVKINDSELIEKIVDAVAQIPRGESSADEKRSERLSEQLDDAREESERLRKENYSLQSEIFRLKELLIKNGISYD